MTIPSSTMRVSYGGDGSSTAFPTTFVFFGSAELDVVLVSAAGVTSYLILGTDYTVGGGNGSTGTVTMTVAPAAGSNLVIFRLTNRTQVIDYVANDALSAAALERGFDRAAALAAEDGEWITHALRTPRVENGIAELPLAAARENKVLGFDSNGNVTLLSQADQSAETVMATGGASAASLAQRFGHFLNVIDDFSAAGDGVTDDTSAIQAAINSGKSIYFPQTTNGYLVSSAITISGSNQKIFGGGFGSLIKTNSATADLFVVTGTNIEICSLGFSATVTKSAGTFVSFNNASFSLLHDFYMYRFFIGVMIWGSPGPTGVHVSNGYMANGVASLAQGITVFSGGDIVVRDVLVWSGTSTNIQYGVAVYGVGDLTLDHVQIVFGGLGLYVGPTAGNYAQDVTVDGCFFDTCGSGGIEIGGPGVVQLVKICNSWVATATGHGISLNPTGSGVVQQCDILNTISSNNSGDGLLINSTHCVFTNVIGCSFGSNGNHGAAIIGGVGYFRFVGCSFGTSGQFTGNSQYGLSLASGTNDFLVDGNFFNGNTSGAVNFGAPSGSPGSSYWVKNNVGFVTQNSGEFTSSAGPSSFTIAHGLNVTPNIQDISLTLTSGLGAATSFWASAPNATNFSIVFNAAPGAGVGIAWSVRSLGA